MTGWLALPGEWLGSFGDIARFGGRVMGYVYSGRVFVFFGESLRQARSGLDSLASCQPQPHCDLRVGVLLDLGVSSMQLDQPERWSVRLAA